MSDNVDVTLSYAGLMCGPALLGWISDKTTVQTAMIANAAVLAFVVLVFGFTAAEPRHLSEEQKRFKMSHA